jgi:transcriptional regulator with XRE-family HTH domain
MTAITTERKTNKKEVEKVSNKKKVPKMLKKIRMEEGFTIYSLAERLDVNFSSVSYWENGVKHPRHKKIVELEDLFGLSYRELFTDLTPEEIIQVEEMEKEMRRQQFENDTKNS